VGVLMRNWESSFPFSPDTSGDTEVDKVMKRKVDSLMHSQYL